MTICRPASRDGAQWRTRVVDVLARVDGGAADRGASGLRTKPSCGASADTRDRKRHSCSRAAVRCSSSPSSMTARATQSQRPYEAESGRAVCLRLQALSAVAGPSRVPSSRRSGAATDRMICARRPLASSGPTGHYRLFVEDFAQVERPALIEGSATVRQSRSVGPAYRHKRGPTWR